MIFAQTPTVSQMFEGLAVSYRRLMSVGRPVANLGTLGPVSCSHGAKLWCYGGRQGRNCTMTHRETEKPHYSEEIKQDQRMSLVDPKIRQSECDMRVGSIGLSIYTHR